MSTGHDLYRLIRKISGTFESDFIEMFVGEVTAVDSQFLTCTVKDISGKGFGKIDVLYDSKTGKELPQEAITYYNEIYGNESMIYTDVALMSGGSICDGLLIVPKIGSMVTVLKTNKQTYEICKYSEIDAVQVVSQSCVTTIDSQGLVISTKDAKSLYRFQDKIDASSPEFDQPGCYMSVNNNATVYIQDDTKFDMQVNNGAHIKLDSKVKINNQAQDLKTILIDLIDTLKTGVDTGGYSFNPATVALLNTIEARINALMS